MTDSHLTKVVQKVPEAGTADKGVLCALPSATANSQLEQSCRKEKKNKQEIDSRLCMLNSAVYNYIIHKPVISYVW